MLRVFTEYQHSSLYHALHLLFEKRLGWELFCPVGTEWAEKGFWDVTNVYLYPSTSLLTPKGQVGEGGYLQWVDPAEGIVCKGMTMEQFYSSSIDIVLCTHPHHEWAYHQLAKDHNAKFIRLLGNQVESVDPLLSRNIIDTTRTHYRKYTFRCNCVTIYQEFPLDIFRYEPPTNHTVISQFIHVVTWPEFKPIWDTYRQQTPEFTWRDHGIKGEHGNIVGIENLAQAMRDTAFTWHIKRESGGHCALNSMAVGRPLVVVKDFHRGKTLGPLLIDGVTCIDIGGDQVGIIDRLVAYSEPEKHLEMCEAAARRFRQVVDFDEDEQKIRKFLERLR